MASAIPEELTEVRILNAVFNGPFNEYESLIDAWQEHIDTRIMKQQSLLHVAIRLGKVDWVEGLLLRGADTDLQDEGQASALTAAEEMLRKYPDDGFRTEVLRLVRLVNKTVQAEKMRGIRENAREQQNEMMGVQSAIVSISDTVPANVTGEFQSDNVALQASIKHIKEEMASLIKEVKEIQSAISCRDTLLECLEGAITSSAEKLNFLYKHRESSFPARSEGSAHSWMQTRERNPYLIDVLIEKTKVLDMDEDKLYSVRCIYNSLYKNEITACILKYLKEKPQFKVIVGCNSENISYIIPEFSKFTIDNIGVYKGRELNISDWYSFADFSNSTVYLGGCTEDCTLKDFSYFFARSLTQMALYLAYQNGGLPYKGGDENAKRTLYRAIAQAEDKRKSGGLDFHISNALSDRNRAMEFTSIVPSIIAAAGSSAVDSVLQKQVPLLMEYFENHVIPTLQAK